MSGPKAYAYDIVSRPQPVETPQQIARRRRAEAARQVENHQQSLTKLVKLALKYDPDFVSGEASRGRKIHSLTTSQLTPDLTLDDLIRRTSDMLEGVKYCNQRIEELRMSAALKSMREALSFDSSMSSFDILSRQFAEQSTAQPQGSPSAGSRQEENNDGPDFGEIFTQLARIENDHIRDGLVAETKAITGRQWNAKKGALVQLLARVNEVMRDQENKKRLVRKSVEICGQFYMSEEDSKHIFELAAKVETDIDLNNLALAAETVKQKRQELADEQFVREAAVASLREMGYEVEIIDPDACGEKIEIRALHSKIPDHAMQVRLLPGDRRLLTKVVALKETTTQEDEAAEVTMCNESLTLTHKLQAHGIASQRLVANPIGSIPVERVNGSSTVRDAPTGLPKRAQKSAPRTASKFRQATPNSLKGRGTP